MQEDVNNLQKNMVKIQTDIGYIKDSLKDNKEEHKEILDKIERWIETSEQRFAPKWAADVIKWTGGVVGTAVLIALLSLIIK